MKSFTGLIFSCIFVLLLDKAMPLRCRTGSQNTDDRFQKILQRCANRQLNNARDNDDDSSSDDDSDERSDDSDEKMFNIKFGNGRDANNADNSSRNSNNMNNGNYNNDAPQSRPNLSNQPYPYNKQNNMTNVRSSPTMDDRAIQNMRGDRFGHIGMNSDNDEMQNNEHNMACVVHCFFNALNLVDARGYPEKNAVIGIMTQGIQDPELHDFVEETVIHCFHLINTDMNKEKCKFSQSLMTCMEEKGRERCEDWDDTYSNS